MFINLSSAAAVIGNFRVYTFLCFPDKEVILK